ncbi:hypothetical protein MRB53_039758 [Persea americana]|nr:hypothetical protein MRB53_039758 [Persea americana]
MSEAPRKRSRFDQTEPDPPRNRSPVEKKSGMSEEARKEALAKAQAAAARINAQLAEKKGPTHVDVPPIQSSLTAKSPDTAKDSEVVIQDGDYIKDIEINDLRNRYTLTKGDTQKMQQNPPLYLHITSTTKEGLDKAVAKIDELINQELPNLIDERRFRRGREQDQVERDDKGRRKWPEERIPIDLEPIPDFNLRAAVVGPQGAHVKHIQSETRCRVQIKGRGSGFMEHDTGVESDENMYLHLAGPDPAQVEYAKELATSLLESVKDKYEAHKERKARGDYGGNHGGYNDRGGGRDRNASGGHSAYGGNNSYGGYQQDYGYGNAQSPTNYAAGTQDAGANTMTPEQYTAWAQYYAQNPAEDPYAAYGGFSVYMQMYYAQMAAGQGDAGQQPPPPPPPQDEQAPPPPPPPGNGQNGSYSALSKTSLIGSILRPFISSWPTMFRALRTILAEVYRSQVPVSRKRLTLGWQAA